MRKALLWALALIVGCEQEKEIPPIEEGIGCAECTLLVGGTLFDGQAVREGTVVLKGDRILTIAPPDARIGAGEVIDVTGRTVLPGLMDLHVHLRDHAGPWGWNTFSFPYVEPHLRALLRAGVTTVLDTGSDRDFIFTLRDRVRAGELLAPDVYAVGSMVTVSGGHPCYEGMPIGRVCVLVDQPSDVDAVEELLLSRSPDAVKVALSPETLLPSLSLESLTAIVDRSRAAGVPVVAHVATADNAAMAAAAGAHALVHMPMLDRFTDVVRLPIVTTFAVNENSYALAAGTTKYDDPALDDEVPAEVLAALRAKAKQPDAPAVQERWLARRAVTRDNLMMAMAAGVPIAVGTDSGIAGTLHGRAVHEELAIYVSFGMMPIDALRAATSNAAQVLGLTDRGVLAEGALADIVVVRGNPAEDIAAIADIELVFRRGEALRPADLALSAPTSIVRTPRANLAAGERCLFAGECVADLLCDVHNVRCTARCTFPSGATCGREHACLPAAAWIGTDYCVPGDMCDLFTQDCANDAACSWIGNGTTTCWPSSSSTHGDSCNAGACAAGHQCNWNTSTCEQLCDPGGTLTCSDATASCIDYSPAAGLEVGMCASP